MTCSSLQIFGNDPLEMESLISWEKGKKIIFLDIFIIFVRILSEPILLLDLRLYIKSLISSGVIGAMMKFSEFAFLKLSVKVFSVGGIFFWRFVLIDVKKLLKNFLLFQLGQ